MSSGVFLGEMLTRGRLLRAGCLPSARALPARGGGPLGAGNEPECPLSQVSGGLPEPQPEASRTREGLVHKGPAQCPGPAVLRSRDRQGSLVPGEAQGCLGSNPRLPLLGLGLPGAETSAA